MFFVQILSIFCSIYATYAWITPKLPPDIDIASEMQKAGIVPQVLPQAPKELLNVTLTRGTLIPGTIIYHGDDETGAEISFTAANNTWYALFVVAKQNWDPEQKIVSRSPNSTAPPYPQEEWHEWVVVNIPGNNVSLGEEYYPYKHPELDESAEMVNLELYLIYQQPGKLEFRRPYEVTLDGEIMKTVHDYVKFYNLTGPIAGNFLYRRWWTPIRFTFSTRS